MVSNKGSAGIDGIPVQELIGYFDTQEVAMLFIPEGITEKDIQTRAEQLAEFERNKAQIVESIMTGKYLPQPIRGVEIPKENGKKRLLGIPTVTDRMLQQTNTNRIIGFPKRLLDCLARGISRLQVRVSLILGRVLQRGLSFDERSRELPERAGTSE